MDAITDFQHSLGGPVFAFLQQFWFVPVVVVIGVAAYWMFGGRVSDGVVADGDGDFSHDFHGGDGSDGGGDGGSD
jgi:hypothetical protein